MKIKYSPYFVKRFQKRLVKNPHFKAKFSKQIKLVQTDLRHPSLKLHKLKGKRGDQYSFWIEGNLRILFIFIDNCIYLTDIVSHDEY
jgi:toxin HigB-1